MLHFNYAIVWQNFVFLGHFVPFNVWCQISRQYFTVESVVVFLLSVAGFDRNALVSS